MFTFALSHLHVASRVRGCIGIDTLFAYICGALGSANLEVSLFIVALPLLLWNPSLGVGWWTWILRVEILWVPLSPFLNSLL